MSLIKTFWISLICLSLMSIIVIGFIGIPAKPVTILKNIPNDRLPQ